MYVLERFQENPVIRPGMKGLEAKDGININGPSLIKVPPWVPGRLGTYYLYFSHHKGAAIRLAYASSIHGPYVVHEGGVLPLEKSPCRDHVASPDVHVDDERREIRMYFHGVAGSSQRTFVAVSRDGLHFSPGRKALGPFYFRVFRYGDVYHAVAKHKNRSGVLLRSRKPCSGFRLVKYILPGMRHAAVHVAKDTLLLFYSRIGDCPESILLSRVDLAQRPRHWRPTEPELILRPEASYEGAGLPCIPSRSGPAFDAVNQVRDPAIFQEHGDLYLLYSVAGEKGIAMGRLVPGPPSA